MAVVSDELTLVIKSNIAGAMTGLQTVETKAAALGASMKTAGALAAKAVVGIGIAAVGVGVASMKMAATFEHDMAQIQALVGVSAEDLEFLKGAALEMGKAYGVSAEDAAAGLFFLTSAGLSAAEAAETLELTAMASAIGLGTLEDLANTATTAMTNFGITAEEAFDMIATAARLAKADPAALGKIMNENSASAALVGMSYADMAGTLALLTRKFGDANKAGTGMGGILRKLVKPSAMAIDMLDAIGVSAEDFSAILAEDLPGGLHQLDEAFAASGVSQTEWLGKVFEDGEAIKAAAAIIGTSGDEISDVFDGMGDAAGALEEGWSIMEETASIKFAQMKEGIKSSLIPIGAMLLDVVVPAVQVLVGWMSTGIEKIVGFVQATKDGATPLAEFGEVVQDVTSYLGELWERGFASTPLNDLPEQIQPIVAWFGRLVVMFRDNVLPAIQNIMDRFKAFGETVEGHKALLGGLAAVIGSIVIGVIVALTTAVWGFIGASVIAVGHVMLVVAAIGALVAGLIYAWNNWDWFREAVMAAVRAIQEYVVPVIADIIMFVMDVFDGLAEWWKVLWPNLLEVLKTTLDLIVRIWMRVWGIIRDNLMAVWQGIKQILSGAIQFIKGLITAFIALIRGDWESFWGGIYEVASGFIYMIIGIVETLWALVNVAWDAGVAILVSAWDVFWTYLGSAITDSGLAAGFQGIMNGIIGGLENMVNTAIGMINHLIGVYNSIPGLANKTLIPSVKLPRLADGGTTRTAGDVLVGERGPEILSLPKAATVTPLQGKNAFSGGGGNTVSINIARMEGRDPKMMAQELGWEFAKRGVA